MLVDRGFDANGFLTDLAAPSAQSLVRLKSTRRPPLTAVLPDGSRLVRLGTLTVRLIEADLTLHLADGATVAGHYRLATRPERRYPLDPSTVDQPRLVLPSW